MDAVDLLAKFADPQVIKTLSASQRLFAGLITTLLGMGITFVSLVILQFVIGLMEKLCREKTSVSPLTATVEISPTPSAELENDTNNEQLIAAITATVAMTLKTTAGNIIIRNIRKIEDHSPAWNRAGIAEHMNNNS